MRVRNSKKNDNDCDETPLKWHMESVRKPHFIRRLHDLWIKLLKTEA